jgi:hypothetical protein
MKRVNASKILAELIPEVPMLHTLKLKIYHAAVVNVVKRMSNIDLATDLVTTEISQATVLVAVSES